MMPPLLSPTLSRFSVSLPSVLDGSSFSGEEKKKKKKGEREEPLKFLTANNTLLSNEMIATGTYLSGSSSQWSQAHLIISSQEASETTTRLRGTPEHGRMVLVGIGRSRRQNK
ncbi:hypothetical protein AWENTII_010181 [Aspergillus wentii]